MIHSFIRKKSISSFNKHESNINNVFFKKEKNSFVKSRRYKIVLAFIKVYINKFKISFTNEYKSFY